MRGIATVGAFAALCGACLVVRRDPDPPQEPSRLVAGFQQRLSVSTIDEPAAATDGADGAALGFGLKLFAGARVAPRAAVGICLDVAVLPHATTEPHTGALYFFGNWGLTARAELDHVTLETWGTWYFGHRGIAEDDAFGSKSGVDLRGPGLAIAARWRVAFRAGPSFEAGPFVQVARLHGIEDEPRTELDEHGMVVTSVQVGLALGLTFGARD